VKKLTKLSKSIVAAYKSNKIVSAMVYGPQGIGKTSYAIWTAYYVLKELGLGGWDDVLNYVFFEPKDALEFVKNYHDAGKRVPILVMDDAGYWLNKLSWWEKDKRRFLEMHNLIRSTCAGVIYTTPSRELPSALRDQLTFIVKIVLPTSREKLIRKFGREWPKVRSYLESLGVNPNYWRLAYIYCTSIYPSLSKRVMKRYHVEFYPLHYPKPVYEKYEEIRRKYVAMALKRTLEAINEIK